MRQNDEIVRKARSGDKKALEQLLRDNYKIVYGYLFKLTMNEESAKDFTQETMVKAIMHIKNFKGSSKFSTWLVSIASNVFKETIRRRSRTRDITMENIKLPSPDNVEDTVIDREDMSRLKSALLSLPEKKRAVFVLKHFYGYSYKEIAGILECPIGTVRSRLHYCISTLQEELK